MSLLSSKEGGFLYVEGQVISVILDWNDHGGESSQDQLCVRENKQGGKVSEYVNDLCLCQTQSNSQPSDVHISQDLPDDVQQERALLVVLELH